MNMLYVLIVILAAAPLYSAETLTRADVKEIVYEALREKPEIIKEAIVKLKEKKEQEEGAQSKKLIQENQDILFKDGRDPLLGNPKGSQTMIAFLDPYCGHCRHFHDVLNKAFEKMKDLRVIVKDFPIFGEPSEKAVKALWAAASQGKYKEYQDLLFKTENEQKEEDLIVLAKKVSGLDVDKFKKEMASEEIGKRISDAKALGEKMGVHGTPMLIVGDTMIAGGLPLDALEKVLKKKST